MFELWKRATCRPKKSGDMSPALQGNKGSGRSDGISPATPPTPPDKRFSRIRRLNPAVIPQDLTISSVSHSQRSFSRFPHVPSLAGLSPTTPAIHPGSGQRRRRVGAEVAAPSCCVELRARDFFIIYHGFNLVVFRGSSALRSFRLSPVIFTTMASADSRLALTRRASPGKVHELSDPNRRILPGTSFRC